MKTALELMSDSEKVTPILMKRYEGCGVEYTIDSIVFDALNILSKTDKSFLYECLLETWSK